jgi:hypothetical protein
VKIVIFSTTDGPGGAGMAALRLHRAFRAMGQESILVVWTKTSFDDGVECLAGPDEALARQSTLFARQPTSIIPRLWTRTCFAESEQCYGN